MYSQIIDQKTYAAVVAAAPSVPGEYETLAQDIVFTLRDAIEYAEAYIDDGQRVLHMPIKELATRLAISDVSPNQAGRVLEQLGLLKARKRDGYHVYWTVAQIDILAAALLEVPIVD